MKASFFLVFFFMSFSALGQEKLDFSGLSAQTPLVELYAFWDQEVMGEGKTWDSYQGEADIWEELRKGGRQDLVLPFVRAFKAFEPQGRIPNPIFSANPLSIALERRDLDLARGLALAAPELLSRPSYKGAESDGPGVGWAFFLEEDYLMLEFLDEITGNQLELVLDWGGKGPMAWDFTSNALSFAKSVEMKRFLKERGIPQFSSRTVQQSHVIIDDNVNIRSGPGLEHPVVFQLNTGDPVEILQYTYERFAIPGYGEGPWVQVKADSREGWVFFAFLNYWMR
jgi:hypothetical protein